MKYEDFPILQNEQYQFLNEHFNIQKFDRDGLLHKLCNQIICCINTLNTIRSQHNKKTTLSINTTCETLEKQLSNLTTLFKANIYNHEFKESNIFVALKKLSELVKSYIEWHNQETKEYYKRLALRSSKEIIIHLTETLSVLAESEFSFFKHM